LRQALRPLAERGLVVYLTPEGRRGTTLTHGFQTPKELEIARSTVGTSDVAAESVPSREPEVPRGAASALYEVPRAEARAEIADLRKLVAELQTTVTALEKEVRTLKQALGG
ncbi:MAG: hypothetical protein L0212_01375, partial [Acidobacteria bacterium]|nr:hypothetical protein [Acidobacteriota bacterium]